MKTKAAIGGAVGALILSGLIIFLGSLALKMWQASRWVALVGTVAAALVTFAFLTAAVKEIGDRVQDELPHVLTPEQQQEFNRGERGVILEAIFVGSL